jgi:hypothetical protein
MPRVYASNNDPIDFCDEHFPTLEKARAAYGAMGDGPDGRGSCFTWDADHPDYMSDGDMYRCITCGIPLDRGDNAEEYWKRRPTLFAAVGYNDYNNPESITLYRDRGASQPFAVFDYDSDEAPARWQNVVAVRDKNYNLTWID